MVITKICGKHKKLFLFKKQHLNILLVFFFFLISTLYFQGAYLNATIVNTDMNKTDQVDYLEFSEKLLKSNYTYLGSRNRMPFFSFLLSFIYEEDIDDFFLRAKLFNIVISFIFLSIIFLIFLKYLPLLYSTNLILIIAFTFFIFKAPYTQSEITYYFLFFICFLLLLSLLKKVSIEKSMFVGFLLGLTYLTKVGIYPMLIIFLFIFLFKEILLLIYTKKPKKINSMNERTTLFRYVGRIIESFFRKLKIKNTHIIYNFICLFLLISSFFLITGPYLHDTKKIYGSYFYNVNSNFYMWYDSWEECERGTKAYGDREHYPDMPPDLIPGPIKYFKEHNPKQIFMRLVNGFIPMNQQMIHSYGYYKYIIFLSILFFINFLFYFKKFKQYFKKYFFPIIFFISIVISYILLISWYSSIDAGNRFILVLFLPISFLLYYSISKLNKYYLSKRKKIIITINKILNYSLFFIICFEIYIILLFRITVLYGGN